jgi:hypothetical protein
VYSALKIGDPASDKRLAEIRLDHEQRLADPFICAEERRELESSLECVRAAEFWLAILDPARPQPEAMR